VAEGAPDSVLIAFIERWMADRERGHRHAASHYEEIFPGFEDAIRAEHARLESGDVEADRDRGGRDGWIGPYRLLRLVGEGGQGAVYEASDSRLGRRAAVKVLRRLETPEALKRFHREASLLASFDHPALCTLYEAGQHEGRPFIAMRFVEGRPLAALVHEQRDSGPGPVRLPGTEAGDGAARTAAVVRLIEKVARALDFAHEKGVIHRDVKPANVVLDAAGEPIVIDFGLARGLDTAGSMMTQSGDMLGTPGYLAPEHVAGRPGDRRLDVYALGVTLFECLTKRLPFEAPTREALLVRILEAPPPDPRPWNAAIGGNLLAVIETALAKDRTAATRPPARSPTISPRSRPGPRCRSGGPARRPARGIGRGSTGPRRRWSPSRPSSSRSSRGSAASSPRGSPTSASPSASRRRPRTSAG
jgi:serine/threonine-protein kinase